LASDLEQIGLGDAFHAVVNSWYRGVAKRSAYRWTGTADLPYPRAAVWIGS
jgi:hypothetical protein